jgi:hypothetical protein
MRTITHVLYNVVPMYKIYLCMCVCVGFLFLVKHNRYSII